MNMISPEAAANSKRAWLKILARYKKPDRRRSTLELAITLIPFVTLWALSSAAYSYGYWWGLMLILPAAGFLVRIFMIQHDCGHGSFFANRYRRRLDRPRARRADADALRLLAPRARHPSRQRRQSRRARHGRHQDADRRRIPACPGGAALPTASTAIRW